MQVIKTSSKNKLKPLNKIKEESNQIFKEKYKTDLLTYNMKVINEIVYNEKTRLVAKFKDFLILDDSSEFLRRFYNKAESRVRLQKIIGFYETYSRIFPNYIIIPESKYLYRNIRRKQKIIDQCNNIKKDDVDRKQGKSELKKKGENFFDSVIKRSIMKYQPSCSNLETSFMNEKSQSFLRTNLFNGNKNMMDNEDSRMSVESILNILEKKKIVIKDNVKDNLRENHTQSRTLMLSESNEYSSINNQNNFKNVNKEIKNKLKQIILSDNKGNNNKINKGQFLNLNNLNNLNTIGLNDTKKTTMRQSNINTVTNETITSSQISEKKKINHRASQSIPEVIRVINNYPSIIIPNSSTHVSINQNYYMGNIGNMGHITNSTCQSPAGPRIIMIENYETNPDRIKSGVKYYDKENIINENNLGYFRSNTLSNNNKIINQNSLANTLVNSVNKKINKTKTISLGNDIVTQNFFTKSKSSKHNNFNSIKSPKVIKNFNDNIKNNTTSKKKINFITKMSNVKKLELEHLSTLRQDSKPNLISPMNNKTRLEIKEKVKLFLFIFSIKIL